MHELIYVLTVIAAMTAITLGLRALPFLAGRWLRRHALVHKLGDTLPLSIMVLLLVDTIAGQASANPSGPWWQELLSTAVVLALQWRTRQTLLSIVVGTALYLLLRSL